MLGLHVKKLNGDTEVIIGESRDRRDWLIDWEDGQALHWWNKEHRNVVAPTREPARTDAVYGEVVFRTHHAVIRTRESHGSVIIVIHKVSDGVEQLPGEYVNGGKFLYF